MSQSHIVVTDPRRTIIMTDSNQRSLKVERDQLVMRCECLRNQVETLQNRINRIKDTVLKSIDSILELKDVCMSENDFKSNAILVFSDMIDDLDKLL